MSISFTKAPEPPRVGPLMNQALTVLNKAAAKEQVFGRFSKSFPNNKGLATSYPPSSRAASNAAIYARLYQEFMALNDKEMRGTITATEEKRLQELASILPQYAPKATGSSRKSRKDKRVSRRISRRSSRRASKKSRKAQRKNRN